MPHSEPLGDDLGGALAAAKVEEEVFAGLGAQAQGVREGHDAIAEPEGERGGCCRAVEVVEGG